MKKLLLYTLSALLLAQVSCKKDSGSDDEEEEEQFVWIGNVTFYITQSPGDCDNLQIILSREDGTKSWQGSIAKTNLASSTPTSCSGTVGYTFKDIPYGKYKYNTNCCTRHLNGPITVDNECIIRLMD